MGNKRSVLQRMKDRTSDVDAAVSAMSRGDAPPKIGGVHAPAKKGGVGGAGSRGKGPASGATRTAKTTARKR